MTRLRWVPLLLAIVAEAAWISVVAGFIEEIALRQPVLGVPAFAVAVAFGVVLARLAGGWLGERWPLVGLGIAIAAAAAGVLAAPEAREAVAASGLGGAGPAFAANPGGAFIGVAVLRGYGHANLPLGEDRLGRLLVGGIVTLSLLALVGNLFGEPYRSGFLGDTLVASLLFTATALLALAITRLTVIGAESGADWSRNPAWLGLLLGLLAAIELLATPAAGVIGAAFEILFWLLVGPVLIIGLFIGWTKNTVRAVTAVLLLGLLLVVLLPFITSFTSTILRQPGSGTGGLTSATPVDQGVATISGIVVAIVGAIALVVLIRSWMHRLRVQPDDLLETRTIDHGDGDGERNRGRRALFRTGPHDAAEAYRRLVADLEGRPTVARGAGETPREHARRLRSDGWGRLSLDLLASDYAISQFAEAPLSGVEHRRAVGRWRHLRGDLKPAPILRLEPRAELAQRRVGRAPVGPRRDEPSRPDARDDGEDGDEPLGPGGLAP